MGAPGSSSARVRSSTDPTTPPELIEGGGASSGVVIEEVAETIINYAAIVGQNDHPIIIPTTA